MQLLLEHACATLRECAASLTSLNKHHSLTVVLSREHSKRAGHALHEALHEHVQHKAHALRPSWEVGKHIVHEGHKLQRSHMSEQKGNSEHVHARQCWAATDAHYIKET